MSYVLKEEEEEDSTLIVCYRTRHKFKWRSPTNNVVELFIWWWERTEIELIRRRRKRRSFFDWIELPFVRCRSQFLFCIFGHSESNRINASADSTTRRRSTLTFGKLRFFTLCLPLHLNSLFFFLVNHKKETFSKDDPTGNRGVTMMIFFQISSRQELFFQS